MIRPALLLLTLAAAGCARKADPLPGFPKIVLWAWERPEHMMYINTHAVGVAVLVKTINWRDGRTLTRPRYQPLDIPPDTAVIAVVRIESGSAAAPPTAEVIPELIEAAKLPRVRALQIDFDARASERGWYANLLQKLKPQMPAGVTLEITALASWCLGDPWIKDLPIADAVPMLFRMGGGEPKGITEFSSNLCRNSSGISTDEPVLSLPRNRRLYIFEPRAWTPASYRAAMEIARRLQ